MTNLDSILKSRDITLSIKVSSSQNYGFSSSHVWMWELYHKEKLSIEELMLLKFILEKTLESPLDCKEIKPVNPKGNQSWVFIGRTDAETETPILWPPHMKNWLFRKDPDAGKDWSQEEKGTTEDEMVGWHHRLDRHEFEQVPGVGDGQESLACCSPWGHKESNSTEWLNWTEHTNLSSPTRYRKNLCPLQWKHRVLTTGPRRKSKSTLIFKNIFLARAYFHLDTRS